MEHQKVTIFKEFQDIFQEKYSLERLEALDFP